MKLLSLTLVAGLLAAWISYRVSYRSSFTIAHPEMRSFSSGKARPSRNLPVRTDKIEQLRGLANRPLNERSSAEAWAIISSMSVARIRQALDAVSDGKTSKSVQELEESLYFRWAQINPLEALEAASHVEDSTEKGPLLASAYTAWFKQDPEAAWRWAQTSTLLDKRDCTRLMGRYLATLPPAEAAEKMKTCGPDVVKSSIGYQGPAMISSPEDRKAFLECVANSGMSQADSEIILKDFIRNWGFADPAAALAGLDGIPLSDDEKFQARRRITTGWAEINPVEALAWVAKENPPHAMAAQMAIYSKWSAAAPAEAVAALDGICRDTPGFREEVMKSQLESYYQKDWIPFGRNEAMEKNNFSHLKSHYDDWAATAPADAERWLGTLEPALQQKLHSPADEKQ